jgi:TolB-like protein/DNA-binding winged helix-turn-helix (wHTH) protein
MGAGEVRQFGPFAVDERSGELRRDGEVVRLQPQPFRVLALLVSRPGELVTREELKKALWGEETYVDFERGLNFCINQARTALGDSADAPRYIQTLPRRGYRFIAPVRSESVQSAFRVSSESTPNDVQSAVRVSSESTPNRVQSAVRDGSESTPNRVQSAVRVSSESTLNRVRVVAGAAVLAMLAGTAFFAFRYTPPPPAATPGRTTIAVLPLDDLTGDESPSWFADGLTEELIAQLGRVSPDRLGVIARTSALTYRGSNKSVAEIGRELGVSHLLEGSVRREGERLRITLQLVSVANQTPVWSDTFDRTAHGTLTLQSEVAALVARALTLELLPAAWTGEAWAATRVPEARDAYLRGRHYWNRGLPGDFRQALDQFEDAARLDPAFAAARAAQADALHRLAMFGQMPPADAYARAAVAARDAVRIDPNLAEAQAAAGLVQLWGEWNPAAAAASFERALALNPSDAAAHHDYAWALVALGRFDDAAAHITRARELDPVSPRASSDIGWLHLHIRRPGDALRACRQTLALDPDSVEAQQCLERAHLQRGEITEALSAARTAAAHARREVPAALDEPGTPESRLRSLWRERLERIRAVEGERYVSPYTIAMHHAILGEDEAALDRLEAAYEARVGMMVLLPTDPVFERLHASPRFEALAERIRTRR